jgi:hypothetical protein
MWCNCGIDRAEPKWHSIHCSYRAEWEFQKGTVHMNETEKRLAEKITGWKAEHVKQYYPDELDRIFMQRTEEAYYYGKRQEGSKLNYD